MTLKKLAVLCITVGMGLSAYAQRQLPQAFEMALDRQIIKEAATSSYHPVFGYQGQLPKVALGKLAPVTPFDSPVLRLSNRSVQIAPLVAPATQDQTAQAFLAFKDMSPAQTVQAFYLWRLANPLKPLTRGAFPRFLNKTARNLYEQTVLVASQNKQLTHVADLPNLLLLRTWLNPDVIPLSYAQLDARTATYPKHVMLDEDGFPVKTKDSGYATVLDSYLMLSNPQQMRGFNNAKGYTPFTLTKEEHKAADRLLAKRLAGEKLPANPTERDLIELAYNRLETHTVKYSQIKEAGHNYQAYPNYKDTQLYRLIKEKIKDKNDIESLDTNHLIVLDAVMGGVNPTNYADVSRAVRSLIYVWQFSQSSAAHRRHIQILQENLKVVFSSFLKSREQRTFPPTQPIEDAQQEVTEHLVWWVLTQSHL